jgi:hypothetical protein
VYQFKSQNSRSKNEVLTPTVTDTPNLEPVLRYRRTFANVLSDAADSMGRRWRVRGPDLLKIQPASVDQPSFILSAKNANPTDALCGHRRPIASSHAVDLVGRVTGYRYFRLRELIEAGKANCQATMRRTHVGRLKPFRRLYGKRIGVVTIYTRCDIRASSGNCLPVSPARVVAVNHDTSITQVERTYSRHIGDHADALTRGALLDLA